MKPSYTVKVKGYKDLYGQLLDTSPREKMSMTELMAHPWTNESFNPLLPRELAIAQANTQHLDKNVLRYMTKKLKISEASIKNAVLRNNSNSVSATYHLLSRRQHKGQNFPELSSEFMLECWKQEDDNQQEYSPKRSSKEYQKYARTNKSARNIKESQRPTREGSIGYNMVEDNRNEVFNGEKFEENDVIDHTQISLEENNDSIDPPSDGPIIKGYSVNHPDLLHRSTLDVYESVCHPMKETIRHNKPHSSTIMTFTHRSRPPTRQSPRDYSYPNETESANPSFQSRTQALPKSAQRMMQNLATTKETGSTDSYKACLQRLRTKSATKSILKTRVESAIKPDYSNLKTEIDHVDDIPDDTASNADSLPIDTDEKKRMSSSAKSTKSVRFNLEEDKPEVRQKAHTAQGRSSEKLILRKLSADKIRRYGRLDSRLIRKSEAEIESLEIVSTGVELHSTSSSRAQMLREAYRPTNSAVGMKTRKPANSNKVQSRSSSPDPAPMPTSRILRRSNSFQGARDTSLTISRGSSPQPRRYDQYNGSRANSPQGRKYSSMNSKQESSDNGAQSSSNMEIVSQQSPQLMRPSAKRIYDRYKIKIKNTGLNGDKSVLLSVRVLDLSAKGKATSTGRMLGDVVNGTHSTSSTGDIPQGSFYHHKGHVLPPATQTNIPTPSNSDLQAGIPIDQKVTDKFKQSSLPARQLSLGNVTNLSYDVAKQMESRPVSGTISTYAYPENIIWDPKTSVDVSKGIKGLKLKMKDGSEGVVRVRISPSNSTIHDSLKPSNQ